MCRDNNDYFAGSLGGYEIVYVKHLVQCLAQSRCLVKSGPFGYHSLSLTQLSIAENAGI